MTVTKDVINIPYESLTPLSRKLFRPDVLQYHLRLFFMRGLSTYSTLQKMIKVSVDNNAIVIEGPQYDDETQDYQNEFLENWKIIFENYLLKPGFLDCICQLRFVTVNPVSIYYQLLSTEEKRQRSKTTTLKMKRAIIKPLDVLEVPPRNKIPQFPGQVKDKKESHVSEVFESSYFGDGHVMYERSKDDASTNTDHGTFAEGFVDDRIPADIELVPDRDYPEGIIMNMFPGSLFYGFNYRNIYPKIQDINRLIESGMQVVYMKMFDGLGVAETETVYRRFFRDWGIPVIDFVDRYRLSIAGIKSSLDQGPDAQGFHNLHIPSFFMIQRPIRKFHNAAWAGMNTERRRGLTGIPWAGNPESGNDLQATQPDDGFLSYFIDEGISRRVRGKETIQVFFPLCSILTAGEVRRLLKKYEQVIGRTASSTTYDEDGIVGVHLKSMGEWVLLRAMLRKHL